MKTARLLIAFNMNERINHAVLTLCVLDLPGSPVCKLDKSLFKSMVSSDFIFIDATSSPEKRHSLWRLLHHRKELSERFVLSISQNGTRKCYRYIFPLLHTLSFQRSGNAIRKRLGAPQYLRAWLHVFRSAVEDR